MKPLLFYALVLIVILGLSIDIKITFHPFSVKIGDWWSGLTILFLMGAIVSHGVSVRTKYRIEGYKEGLEEMRKEIMDRYELTPKDTIEFPEA